MKIIFQEINIKEPTQEEIERVELGCAIMQAQFQLMGF